MSHLQLQSKVKFKPRDYQEPILEAIIAHCKKKDAKPAFVDISVGGGKCLAKDTPILMFDGSIKMVQDVVVGDKLMSHDSQPRTVTSTTSGREMMYRVDQSRGDSYTVNESHILSFKLTNQGNKKITVKDNKYSGGEIINLSVTDYLSLPEWKQRELKGWKPENGVDFPCDNKELSIPPYILGVWLGDGSSYKPEICNVDHEVISEWENYAESLGLHVAIRNKDNDDKVNNYYITHGIKRKKNEFSEKLKSYNLFGNKHIPKNYLTASREDRLELLAGILDTDGYMCRGKKFDLVLKQKELAKGVEFLVRSLGMWCTANKCRKTCTNTGATGTYYRMSIGGDTRQIPCRVERRKVTEFNGHGIGKTGVKVTKLEEGDYYGFEISGNDRLFLLGDFTVTHNTAIYAFIADHVASKGGKVMILARQGELVEQNSNFAWNASFKNSIYSASLKQKSKRYPIIYASEGTVARAIGNGGDFGLSIDSDNITMKYNWIPDLLMIDECHQVNFEDPDNQYMKIINFMRRANPKLRIIGGTGSPIRGKKYIVGDFWDERLYELSTAKLVEWGWLVPPIFGFPESQEDGYDFSSIAVDKDNDSFSDSELDEIVLKDPTKTHEIITEIVSRTKDRLGVLIFCSTKRHCKEAVQALPKGSYGIVSDDTPFKERTKIYKASRRGDIKYLVNVGVLATGYNNPRIDTVCYLRPLDSLTLLIQTMGRGFRIPEDDDDFDKTNCLVLDYGDVFSRLGELYENPILEEGLKQSAKKKNEIVPCPKCGGENSLMARRCSNLIDHLVAENNDLREENKRRRIKGLAQLEYSDERCDFFFSFRECPECKTQNDPCARQCRRCDYQLIDPNAKLSRQHYTEKDLIDVESFEIKPCRNDGIYLIYTLVNGEQAKEFFSPFSQNVIAQRIYRSTFVKQHVEPKNLRAFNRLRSAAEICNSGFVMIPKQITHRLNDNNKSVINRKVF